MLRSGRRENAVGGVYPVRDYGGTSGVQFYETLADLDANTPAANDKDANYIRITTGSWQVAPTFLRAVGAISNSTLARAVAESGTSSCVPASMMLCNPNEPLTGSTGDTSSFNPTPGTMFVFSTNGNTSFSPGVSVFSMTKMDVAQTQPSGSFSLNRLLTFAAPRARAQRRDKKRTLQKSASMCVLISNRMAMSQD